MALLSEEKQTHLSHGILQALQKSPDAKIIGEPTKALREIKRVLAEHVSHEQDIDRIVRARLASYSRSIPEGSSEWEILYQKTYDEELFKRKRR
ncbi:MAG: DUF507 family protein [Nitrospirales bacterium]|nr:DUF507 family protein [Nitrospirales bacterium]